MQPARWLLVAYREATAGTCTSCALCAPLLVVCLRDAKNDILTPQSRFQADRDMLDLAAEHLNGPSKMGTFCVVLECRNGTLQYARQGACVNWTELVVWYPAGFPQAGTS